MGLGLVGGADRDAVMQRGHQRAPKHCHLATQGYLPASVDRTLTRLMTPKLRCLDLPGSGAVSPSTPDWEQSKDIVPGRGLVAAIGNASSQVSSYLLEKGHDGKHHRV